MMNKSKDVLQILKRAEDTAEELERPYICVDILWEAVASHNSISIHKIFHSLDIDVNLSKVLAYCFLTEKPPSKNPTTRLNKQSREVLQVAESLAETLEQEDISAEILLLALVSYPKHGKLLKSLLDSGDFSVNDFIEKIVLFIKDLADPFNSLLDEEEEKEEEKQEDEKNEDEERIFQQDAVNETIDLFAVNLNKKAMAGDFDGLVDFENRLKKTQTVLSRERKPNPILVGPAGGGKTAIVELLAREIVNDRVPNCLKGKVVFEVSISDMVAGTEFRGNFEERIKEFINEVMKYDNIILFFDEIHSLIGAGGTGRKGDLEASNILKPYLARGEISCIGATTDYEYNQSFKKNPALDRRFEKVSVLPLSSSQVLDIADHIVESFSKKSGVEYFPEFSKEAIKFCDVFLPNRNYPDKFVDIVDQCGAIAKLEDLNSVTRKTLKEAFLDKGGLLLKKDFKTGLSKELLKRGINCNKLFDFFKTISEDVFTKENGDIPNSIFSFGSESDVKAVISVLENYFKSNGMPYVSVSAKSLVDKNSISGFSEDYLCSLAQKASILEGATFLIKDIDCIKKEAQSSLIQILEEGRVELPTGQDVRFGNSLFLFFSSKFKKESLGFQGSTVLKSSDIDADLKKAINNEFLIEKV